MNFIRRSLVTLSLVAAIALVGCKSVTPTVIKFSTTEAVQYGTSKYPDAKPYVQAAGTVICSQAAGTNLSPDAIITALESSTAANAVKTDNGVAVVNLIIAVYSGAWDLFGGADAVKNNATLQADLNAVCAGITDGLSNSKSRAFKRYLQ